MYSGVMKHLMGPHSPAGEPTLQEKYDALQAKYDARVKEHNKDRAYINALQCNVVNNWESYNIALEEFRNQYPN